MKATALSPRFSPQALRLLVAGLLIAVAGTFALTAYAQGGRHHGGAEGGPMMMMGGRGLERMLDGVNATEQQRTQIKQIVEAARADLKSQREAGRALHEQALNLFTQPTVDANAAEALRQQMQARHEQASKRMLQAMLDISRVLSPEQRVQIAQKIKQRHEMMRRHMDERRQLEGSRK